jgi:hypothetical protein
LLGGLEHGFYDFRFSWECHHPSWRSPSFFQRGGELNHQPDMFFSQHWGPLSLRSWCLLTEAMAFSSFWRCQFRKPHHPIIPKKIGTVTYPLSGLWSIWFFAQWPAWPRCFWPSLVP